MELVMDRQVWNIHTWKSTTLARDACVYSAISLYYSCQQWLSMKCHRLCQLLRNRLTTGKPAITLTSCHIISLLCEHWLIQRLVIPFSIPLVPSSVWWWWRRGSIVVCLQRWDANSQTPLRVPSWTQSSPNQNGELTPILCTVHILHASQDFYSTS